MNENLKLGHQMTPLLECWCVVDKASVIECDEYVQTYRGVDIYLSIPNGGIIAVSAVLDDTAWSMCSEPFKKYFDEEWHITQAKRWIRMVRNILPEDTVITQK